MSSVAETWITRHRLTVIDFHSMGAAGIFQPSDRVELIEGEIIDMAPIGSPHAAAVNRLNKILSLALGESAILSVQNPIILGGSSEPEPDIALLRPRNDFYESSHPTASDVLLIVEVSYTTLRYDREVKIPLYARYKIPEVWLVDLESKLLHTHWTPTEASYANQQTLAQPGAITLRMLPNCSVELSGLL